MPLASVWLAHDRRQNHEKGCALPAISDKAEDTRPNRSVLVAVLKIGASFAGIVLAKTGRPFAPTVQPLQANVRSRWKS